MLMKNLWSSGPGNTCMASSTPSSRQAYRAVMKPTAEHQGAPAVHGPLNQHKPPVGPCIPLSGPGKPQQPRVALSHFFKEHHTVFRFPGGSAGKESACNAGDLGSTPGKIPWGRAWQHTPVFLPGESPWTEGPGGLQSMGSHRVGHD